MFSELPRLIDRNFAIAYATPSAIFLLALVFLLGQLGLVDTATLYTTQLNSDPVLGTAVVVFLGWTVGLLLSAFNRLFVQFFSGYTRFYPLWFTRERQTRQYHAVKRQIDEAYQEVVKLSFELDQSTGGPESSAYTNARDALKVEYKKLDRLRYTRSYYFPYDRDFGDQLILPSKLGNVIRAFETYPRIMYGLDGVSGWYRLIYILPKESHEIIASAKSYFDLWLNVNVLSILWLCVYVLVVLLAKTPIYVIPVATAIGVCWFSSRVQIPAAITWGETIRAAFDVYISKLGRELNYKLPEGGHSFEFWTDFSAGTVYKAHHRLSWYESVASQQESTENASDDQNPVAQG